MEPRSGARGWGVPCYLQPPHAEDRKADRRATPQLTAGAAASSQEPQGTPANVAADSALSAAGTATEWLSQSAPASDAASSHPEPQEAIANAVENAAQPPQLSELVGDAIADSQHESAQAAPGGLQQQEPLAKCKAEETRPSITPQNPDASREATPPEELCVGGNPLMPPVTDTAENPWTQSRAKGVGGRRRTRRLGPPEKCAAHATGNEQPVVRSNERRYHLPKNGGRRGLTI